MSEHNAEPTDVGPATSPPKYAKFMDLRFVIAVMFAIFGVLVTASGFTASNEEIEQAAGINISLWTGVGLLLLSAGFGVWLLLVPPDVPEGHVVDSSDE